MFGAAVAALAVVPTVVAVFLRLMCLFNNATSINAGASVQGIELILLNDFDEFGRIVRVLGIATIPQALSPAAVVFYVKLVEHAIAGALQELGMVQERVFGQAILAVAYGAAGVVTAIDLTIPVIGLDAKVVVSLLSHLATANATLENTLSKRDTGRNTKFPLMLQRNGLVALNIIQIMLLTGLTSSRNSTKQGKNQAKMRYLLAFRKKIYNFAFKVQTHNFVMTEKKITTKVRVYSYNELTEEQKKLVDLARQATMNSYSPYSNFKVGAALMLDNGEIFIGANQENAAFAGICGERAALYSAGANFPNIPVKTVAITSFTRGDFVEEPTAPCGVCRQAFLEFEKNGHPIELILAGKEKIYILDSFQSTMPLSFTEF